LISIIINGESRAFDRAPTCADLISELRLAGKRIAMERNGEIVPRSQFGACILQDGDRLEIVAAVGGG
jgi:sulfur carrier protein